MTCSKCRHNYGSCEGPIAILATSRHTTMTKAPAAGPKRPCSAYALFFRDERRRLIGAEDIGKDGKRKPHRVIGFAALARTIANKWKMLDEYERQPYEVRSEIDRERYQREKREYKQLQQHKIAELKPSLAPSAAATRHASTTTADPSIAILAKQLDDDCADMLVNLFCR